jgi:hypothetical protein
MHVLCAFRCHARWQPAMPAHHLGWQTALVVERQQLMSSATQQLRDRLNEASCTSQSTRTTAERIPCASQSQGTALVQLHTYTARFYTMVPVAAALLLWSCNTLRCVYIIEQCINTSAHRCWYDSCIGQSSWAEHLFPSQQPAEAALQISLRAKVLHCCLHSLCCRHSYCTYGASVYWVTSLFKHCCASAAASNATLEPLAMRNFSLSRVSPAAPL